MITVRDYANQRNVSIQSVYQRIKRKTNIALLEGHTEKKNGKLWLDDEAVRILDTGREDSSVGVFLETGEQNNELKDQVIEIQKQLLTAQRLIAEYEKKEFLLELKDEEIKKQEQTIEQQAIDIKRLHSDVELWSNQAGSQEERASNLQDSLRRMEKIAEDNANEARKIRAELREEREKGFFARLFGR